MTLIWCKRNGRSVTLEAVEDMISVTCPRVGKGEEAEREKGVGRERERGRGRGSDRV